MDILIIGTETNERECRDKFGGSHTYQRVDHRGVEKFSKSGSIVFDFEPNDVSVYTKEGLIVFLDSSKSTLSRLIPGKQNKAAIFGFCGLPTFLNREILEVVIARDESRAALEKVCGHLNTKYEIVADKIGMITPRIICMIINEAYFAIEEKVASRADIDLAMKLGTNYPFGPFEWCERIGIKNVCDLLKGVYEEAKDERYKISSLLEAEVNSFHAKV
jgi:3-hydroxybutyryl-CoA dehydrogenase